MSPLTPTFPPLPLMCPQLFLCLLILPSLCSFLPFLLKTVYLLSSVYRLPAVYQALSSWYSQAFHLVMNSPCMYCQVLLFLNLSCPSCPFSKGRARNSNAENISNQNANEKQPKQMSPFPFLMFTRKYMMWVYICDISLSLHSPWEEEIWFLALPLNCLGDFGQVT